MSSIRNISIYLDSFIVLLCQQTKFNTVLEMFLLKPLMSLLFIATFQDMGEAAPKDVHIHLHGLNKELAKADAGAGGGKLG